MFPRDPGVPDAPHDAPAGGGPAAEILLSTCDGGEFVREFVASLGRQTDRNFRLLVRDDGSADGSPAIVRETAARYGIDLEFLPSSGKHLGVVRSYGELLGASVAPCVFFADQDDRWRDDKISSMRETMREAENKYGSGTPLLVHSDLRVCDGRGKVVAGSFLRRSHLFPLRHTLASLLVQNCVTGCATMINRALRERVLLPFPPEAICHDWYLALLASAVGKIVFTAPPLVDYRLHGGNVFGAPEYTPASWLRTVSRGRAELDRRLTATRRQAGAFLRQYGGLLDPETRATVGAWANLGEWSKLRRLALCLKYGFRKNTFLRTLGMWWAT